MLGVRRCGLGFPLPWAWVSLPGYLCTYPASIPGFCELQVVAPQRVLGESMVARVVGIGPLPTALAPAHGLTLGLLGQQEAGWALAPWKTTSVMAVHTLWALPVHLAHYCLSVSLLLSASVSFSLLCAMFRSFSLSPPLSHRALFLCRDLWRSPMALMCLTRARSTPSTCARSAKCWVTTVAECNDRPGQPRLPLLPAREDVTSPVFLRVAACPHMCWGVLEGLQVWAWGGGP